MNDSFEYDVFISFASKDAVAVQPLYEKLVSFGLRVFWSDKSLEPGGNWFDHIQEGVVNSKHFLLIWTQNAKGSRWVKDEYQTFYRECYQESNGKRLFIIKIDSNNDISSLPQFLRQIHVTDSESYILKRSGIKDPPPPA